MFLNYLIKYIFRVREKKEPKNKLTMPPIN